jgi:hypothetical protein
MKRMMKRQFNFYLLLIALCFVVVAGFLLIYPLSAIGMFFKNVPTHAVLPLLLRVLAVGCLLFALQLMETRKDPHGYRDLLFQKGLFLFVVGILIGVSPFFFSANYYILILAIPCVASGIFLLMFASRILLVRE